jgi:hypothetical protein
MLLSEGSQVKNFDLGGQEIGSLYLPLELT